MYGILNKRCLILSEFFKILILFLPVQFVAVVAVAVVVISLQCYNSCQQ